MAQRTNEPIGGEDLGFEFDDVYRGDGGRQIFEQYATAQADGEGGSCLGPGE